MRINDMASFIENIVASKYGAVAQSGLSNNDDGVRAVAEAFGYSAGELGSIPAEANMGLSCGNPTAFANLREGETVVDLGCGGGLDVFLAAQKVGARGKAIGIDMTPKRLGLARKDAAPSGATNGQGLLDAGFAHVQVIDSGADLNAYAMVENQAGCCSPPATSSTGLPIANTGCCGGPSLDDQALHARLADLMRRHSVNDYAASVK